MGPTEDLYENDVGTSLVLVHVSVPNTKTSYPTYKVFFVSPSVSVSQEGHVPPEGRISTQVTSTVVTERYLYSSALQSCGSLTFVKSEKREVPTTRLKTNSKPKGHIKQMCLVYKPVSFIRDHFNHQ